MYVCTYVRIHVYILYASSVGCSIGISCVLSLSRLLSQSFLTLHRASQVHKQFLFPPRCQSSRIEAIRECMFFQSSVHQKDYLTCNVIVPKSCTAIWQCYSTCYGPGLHVHPSSLCLPPPPLCVFYLLLSVSSTSSSHCSQEWLVWRRMFPPFGMLASPSSRPWSWPLGSLSMTASLATTWKAGTCWLLSRRWPTSSGSSSSLSCPSCWPIYWWGGHPHLLCQCSTRFPSCYKHTCSIDWNIRNM